MSLAHSRSSEATDKPSRCHGSVTSPLMSSFATKTRTSSAVLLLHGKNYPRSFRTWRTGGCSAAIVLVVWEHPELRSTTMARPKVYFDVTIDSVPAGRITMELYDDVVPETAENFRAL